MQGEKVQDFYNGFCVRFADDILITARTEEDAQKFKTELIRFAKERDLSISEKKTKIVNIKEGFDFLSRTYYKSDGILECKPSEKSVAKFEQEIKELVEEHKEKWSQRKFIQAINNKIIGYATYHKCEDATDTFRHLDVMINLLLFKMIKEKYNNLKRGEITKRYWKRKDSEGRRNFSLQKNLQYYIKNMADTVLVQDKPIDLKKNVFLDREYFEDLEKNRDVQNCVGKYRKLWDKQQGKCYICDYPIKIKQERIVIMKNNASHDKTIRNLAYVHKYCKDSIIRYIDVKDEDLSLINIREILEELEERD